MKSSEIVLIKHCLENGIGIKLDYVIYLKYTTHFLVTYKLLYNKGA